MNFLFKSSQPFIIKLIFLFIILNAFNWFLIISFLVQPLFRAYFLDVGQGDSEFLKTKTANILIDAGPNNKVINYLNQFLPFYDKTLDVIILSHPNIDHYQGLFEVLKNFKVRVIILNNISYSSSNYQKLLDELLKRNILLVKGVKGVKINLNNQQEIILLSPDQLNSSNINQDSIVAHYINPLTSILFLGDVNAKTEKEIMRYIDSKKYLYRILKVAHHGSKYSSDEEFLNDYLPQYAIIEVGKNNYSHPHFSTIERLRRIQANIFQTISEGTILFFLDKNLNLKVKNFK